MEKQQVGNDSRLSLDQRFSGGGRRSSTRLRHQSLDRGMGRLSLDQRFTWTAIGDSQAASQSLGQRTIGADDKRPTTARSVCPSIPVALSVHCRSDEPDRNVDYTDESLELPSLGQRTAGAGHRLPMTSSATIGTRDLNDKFHSTTIYDCDVGSIRRWTAIYDPIDYSRFNGQWSTTTYDSTALPMGTSTQTGATDIRPLVQRQQPSSVGYWTSSSQDSRRTAEQPCRSTTTYDCKSAIWSLDKTSVCRSRPRLSWTSDYVKSQRKHVKQRRRLDL